jgi:hypothetical protein
MLIRVCFVSLVTGLLVQSHVFIVTVCIVALNKPDFLNILMFSPDTDELTAVV